MQPSINKSPASDDEEDLESLRLAALQSLKRQIVQQPTGNGSVPIQNIPQKPALCNNPKPFGGPKNVIKRGRGFHGGSRPPRNAPYSRVRNTNLISVPTIEPERSHETIPDVTSRNKKFTDDSVPKLILPQDRYCNIKTTSENKSNEASSKFDRYNDSDNSESESESEEEENSIETESPKKLERANSLEALMQELENEIQGEAKPVKVPLENAPKPKKIKKPRKSKQDVVETTPSESDENTDKDNKDKYECKKIDSNIDNNSDVKSDQKGEVKDVNLISKSPIRQKSKSPLKHVPIDVPSNIRERSLTTNNSCISQNLHENPSAQNISFINSNLPPVASSVIPFQQTQYTNFNAPLGHLGAPYDPPLSYNFPQTAPLGVLNDVHSSPSHMFSPNRYERPVSPLTINTNILNTISAPLSPRSAAFVLQNREIVERRKKSPRRSFSRSPSPEYRRSLSPRYRRSNSRPSRSPSPIRSRRQSPNRRPSPPNNRRLSPNLRRISPNSQPSSRRNSPHTNSRYRLTPPKRSSPVSRISPKRSRKSPPPPQRSTIRNRLGNVPQSTQADMVIEKEKKRKRSRSRSISLSLSPSPERFSCNNSPNHNSNKVEDNMADAVLEARKRKFEGSGTVPTEGIIRLKPKVNSDEDVSPRGDSDTQEIEHQDQDDKDELNEDELLGGDDAYIDFNVKVDDLFSDEESDNENEGRFKSNRQASGDMTVMPFTQLLNEPVKNARSDPLTKDKHSWEKERRDRNYFSKSTNDRSRNIRNRNSPERRDRERNNRFRPTDSPRSRSPLGSSRNLESRDTNSSKGDVATKNLAVKPNMESTEKSVSEKRSLKSTLLLKIDSKSDRRRQPIVSPIENKKIEIKIRNPSKYEVDGQNKDEEQTKDKKNNSRKVEVANGSLANETENDKDDFDEPEPEIIIENEDEEDDDIIKNNKDTGDLRAQLSRKRAERQNKLPKMEGVSSRLLQNALQGAVYKKSKKSKSKKKNKEADPVDDDVDTSVYAAIKRTTAKTGYGITNINHCSTASKDRKVRVLHCDAEPLTTTSDGKLPIHLRLGIPGNTDIFADSKTRKISRKGSNSRGTFNQV